LLLSEEERLRQFATALYNSSVTTFFGCLNQSIKDGGGELVAFSFPTTSMLLVLVLLVVLLVLLL